MNCGQVIFELRPLQLGVILGIIAQMLRQAAGRGKCRHRLLRRCHYKVSRCTIALSRKKIIIKHYLRTSVNDERFQEEMPYCTYATSGRVGKFIREKSWFVRLAGDRCRITVTCSKVAPQMAGIDQSSRNSQYPSYNISACDPQAKIRPRLHRAAFAPSFPSNSE